MEYNVYVERDVLKEQLDEARAELARVREERDGLRSELAFVAIELEGLMPSYVVENTSAFSDDYPFSTRVRPGLVRRIRAALAVPKGPTP